MNEMLFFVAKDHVKDILAERSDAQHDDRLRSFNGLLRELIVSRLHRASSASTALASSGRLNNQSFSMRTAWKTTPPTIPG